MRLLVATRRPGARATPRSQAVEALSLLALLFRARHELLSAANLTSLCGCFAGTLACLCWPLLSRTAFVRLVNGLKVWVTRHGHRIAGMHAQALGQLLPVPAAHRAHSRACLAHPVLCSLCDAAPRPRLSHAVPQVPRYLLYMLAKAMIGFLHFPAPPGIHVRAQLGADG